MFATRLFPAAESAFSTTTRTFTRTSPKSTPFVPRNAFHQASTSILSRTRQRIYWQGTWRSSQKRGYAYRRQAFNYQRFQRSSNFVYRWAARPTFYYEVGGITVVIAGFYVYHLEPVPVSGRRRFNIISPATEVAMSESAAQQVKQEFGDRIMSSSSKEHRMVQRVLNRLIPHSGLEGEKWEAYVIDDNMKNAFVIPGGKVFVFRGILDVCQGDDGLAAVLGHEIAHNVARHAAERMSRSAIGLAAIIIGSSLVGIDPGIGQLLNNLIFSLPGSRAQEQEADYIGLLMMAESCYDPNAAVGLWSRMEKEEQNSPPQFLSTHPSSHNRLEKIRTWLPEAEMKLDAGGCRGMGQYVDGFKEVADFARW